LAGLEPITVISPLPTGVVACTTKAAFDVVEVEFAMPAGKEKLKRHPGLSAVASK
jgi:hypothetical protein